jgi:hypothetical protein
VRFSLRPRALLCLCLALGACFDSDDKFRTEGTTGGTTTATTSFTDTGGTGILTTAGETGVEDCNDAIECIQDCAIALATNMLPEPDLGCFLDCAQPLKVEEVVVLFEFGNCVSVYCASQGCCIMPEDSAGDGSSSGSSSESTSSAGTGSSTETGSTTVGTGSDSGGTGGGPMCGPFADLLMDNCMACIFDQMVKEPEDVPPACMELAAECRMVR